MKATDTWKIGDVIAVTAPDRTVVGVVIDYSDTALVIGPPDGEFATNKHAVDRDWLVFVDLISSWSMMKAS